ncbi:hypothetical protein G6F56_013531 [Rhizopus delemar]|nr:hypothetical protein G6F56_013531 [Rhizopus delemar]
MPPHKKLMVKDFLDELCRGEVIQDMQPPAVQQPRGRSRGAENRVASRNISSTQRDPSSFEYMEGRSSAMRRCGVCSGTDHNRRRYP